MKQSVKLYCFHVDGRMYVFLKYESSRPYSITHIRSSLRNRILHHTFSRTNSCSSPCDRRESQCTRNHLQSIRNLSGSNRRDALTWYTRDRYTLLGGLPCNNKTASECCEINRGTCGDEYFVGYASAKKLLQRSSTFLARRKPGSSKSEPLVGKIHGATKPSAAKTNELPMFLTSWP